MIEHTPDTQNGIEQWYNYDLVNEHTPDKLNGIEQWYNYDLVIEHTAYKLNGIEQWYNYDLVIEHTTDKLNGIEQWYNYDLVIEHTYNVKCKHIHRRLTRFPNEALLLFCFWTFPNTGELLHPAECVDNVHSRLIRSVVYTYTVIRLISYVIFVIAVALHTYSKLIDGKIVQTVNKI